MVNSYNYRNWVIEYGKGLYEVWCDDILYCFDTEDKARDFIDRMIEKGCND